MRIPRKASVDLEYPKGYFWTHSTWRGPTTVEWLLVSCVTIGGTVFAFTFPAFFVIRRLYRRNGLRGQLILYAWYLIFASVPFAGTVIRLILWGWEQVSRIVGEPNVRRDIKKRARLIHATARDAVLSAELRQRRFALMVRDFHNERDLPSLMLPLFSPRLHVEESLARIFEGRMPVVTLANPVDDASVSFLETGILRLFVYADQWQRTFRRLASHAAIILVLNDGPGGPGLAYELAVVEELKRQADSIVLTRDDLRALQAMRQEFSMKDHEEEVVNRTYAPDDIDSQSDPSVTHLLAKIAADGGSGLVQLRERFAKGQL